MSEPIRLVCPDCDTVHRVKAVTLGKLYRCKKCKAGLITMSPAVVRCPMCGKGHPPAHVDVSRLITCDECAGAPLMALEFPPPVRPVREIHASDPIAQVQVDESTNSFTATEPTAIPTETEPAMQRGTREADVAAVHDGDQVQMSFDDETPPLADAPISDEAALVIHGQEQRAVQALKKAMDEVQAPLIQEIERTRSSVPIYVLALVSLPVVAILGYLTFSHLRSRAQAEELTEVRTLLEASQNDLKRAFGELDEARAAASRFMKESQTLKPRHDTAIQKLTATKKTLEAMTRLVKKWQKIATENVQKTEALKQRLRALGQDPDTVATAAQR